MSAHEDAITLFAMASNLIEHDLDRIEHQHAIDLRRGHRSMSDVDDAYYPQIDSAIRAEAASMAPHHEVFYSLETTIRQLVHDQLQAAQPDWWDKCVPEHIRKDAEKRQKQELDAGVTPRSDDPIDYTNFGELGIVITSNWDVFGGLFTSAKAVTRVMASLNTLRAPIAHCSPLGEDEVVRLQLAVRDWFRLQE